MSATSGQPIDNTEYIARTAVTNGSTIVKTTAAQAGKDWCAIVILNDTVIASYTCSGMSTGLDGLTLPAGLVIFGNFSAITLTSGAIQGIHRGNG